MPTASTAAERTRRAVVCSMRACIALERLPIPAKWAYVSACQQLLKPLGIAADDAPLETDYGIRVAGGAAGSFLGKVVLYRRAFEPVLSEFILRHVEPGDVCVDAGANVGYFSMLLASRAGPSGRVVAIEAAPGNVRRLRENLDLNGLADQVDVVPAACAPEPGAITFHLHPSNDMWARLTPPEEGDRDRLYMGKQWRPITVESGPLRDLVGDDAERTSFIKLDIEGAEPAITPEIVAAFPHPNLVVALEAKAPRIAETLQPFRDHGFHVYDLHNDYRWMFERRATAEITPTTYDALEDASMVDVLLSRRMLRHA